ncbi:MAG: hypothetical protein V4510_07325 [bacterium]
MAPARGRRALVALAFAVLVILPATSSPSGGPKGWGQIGGGGAHSGYVELGDQPLDVLVHGNVLAEDRMLANFCCGPLQVGDETLVLSIAAAGATTPLNQATDTCQLVRFGADLKPMQVGADIPCPSGGRLVAYLPSGLAIVAVDGRPGVAAGPGIDPSMVLGADQEVSVRAIDMTGTTRWVWHPPVAASGPAFVDENDYSCLVAADDAVRLVAACANDQGNNVVARLDPATGKAAWNATVMAPVVDAGGVAPAPQPAQGRFALLGPPTLVGDSVVVKGYVPSTISTEASTSAAMAWLSLDRGTQTGYVADDSLATDPTGAQGNTGQHGGSAYAASNGIQAAAFVGNQLVFVTPGVQNPTFDQSFTLGAAARDAAGPAWGHETLVVPTQTTAYVVTTIIHGPRPFWSGDQQGLIGQVIVDRDRFGLATVSVPTANGTQDLLDMFALPSADMMSRLPIPLDRAVVHGGAGVGGITDFPATVPNIIDLGDGRLLTCDNLGNVALLGPRPPPQRPVLSVDNAYPRLDEQVALYATPPPWPEAPRTLYVGWGDGDYGVFAANETPQNLYRAAGDVSIRATFVYANGTTATAALTIHPGRDEPNLNFFQRAFLPENQNYTFFGVGLFLTLFGAIFAAMGATRGRRRLAKYLARLDAIHESGRAKPFEATRALHDFREDCRADLARGKLDNAQFTVVESRANQVLQLLRQRVLGSFLGRTSETFNHALDLALLDGSIDPAESRALVDAVGREKGLAATERDALASLVSSWTAQKASR